MTIAYWCILIAAALPYLWIVIAKSSAPGYNNKDPRGWIAKQQENYRVRNAHAAHLNAFEAFAPFAAAVLMAQFAGVAPERISMLAVAFIVLRVLHGVFYIASVPLMRSLVWLGGLGCVVALMSMAAMAVGG